MTTSLTVQTQARLSRLHQQVMSGPRLTASLDTHRFGRYLLASGPFPDPTILLGRGDDGFPVILELNNPAVGSLLVTGAGQGIFVQALVVSLAFLNFNRPWRVQVETIGRAPLLTWARRIPMPDPVQPGKDDIWKPGRHGILSEYTILLVQGTEYLRMPRVQDIIANGPRSGVWPFVLADTAPVGWPGPIIAGLGNGRYQVHNDKAASGIRLPVQWTTGT